MSIDNASDNRPQTWEQALADIENDGAASVEARRRLRSDLRVAADCISKSAPRADGSGHHALSNLPCNPVALRPLLMLVRPARFWKDKHRWSSIRSSIAKMLRLTGWMDCNRSPKLPLDPAWLVMVGKVAHPTQHALVQNFARFCLGRNVGPQAVRESDLEAYRAHRLGRTIDCDISETINVLRRAWNRVWAGNKELSLHQLDVRKRPGSYVLPDSELPPDLLSDMAAYLARLAKPGPFDRVVGRPRSQVTIACLEKIMKRMASVLLTSGFKPEDVQCVADLVRPKATEAILLDQYERIGKGVGWAPGSVTIASYLKMLAKHSTQLSEAESAATFELCSSVKPPKIGMTRKNRDRLSAFDNPEILAHWKNLPWTCFAMADQRFKEGKTVRAAQLHQAALALAVLQCKPLRRKNLAELNVQKHFRYDRHGRAVSFCIDGSETKSGLDAEAVLSEPLITRLDIHLQKYRPILVTRDCPYLFPGKYRDHINPQSLANVVTDLVEDYVGVDYNIHFTRHLIATIIFDAGPENGPIAQRMLDHTRLKITAAVYGSQRTRGAQAAYNRILEGAGAAKPAAPGKFKRGKSKKGKSKPLKHDTKKNLVDEHKDKRAFAASPAKPKPKSRPEDAFEGPRS